MKQGTISFRIDDVMLGEPAVNFLRHQCSAKPEDTIQETIQSLISKAMAARRESVPPHD